MPVSPVDALSRPLTAADRPPLRQGFDEQRARDAPPQDGVKGHQSLGLRKVDGDVDPGAHLPSHGDPAAGDDRRRFEPAGDRSRARLGRRPRWSDHLRQPRNGRDRVTEHQRGGTKASHGVGTCHRSHLSQVPVARSRPDVSLGQRKRAPVATTRDANQFAVADESLQIPPSEPPAVEFLTAGAPATLSERANDAVWKVRVHRRRVSLSLVRVSQTAGLWTAAAP